MAENKTKPTGKSVERFLNQVENEKRRLDGQAMLKIMKQATGLKPEMWGDSLVGFGRYHYKYDSGREGDFFLTGFSPRKQNLVVYIMPGLEKYDSLMKKLGKYKTGRSCLYINKLEDVDRKVLSELIKRSTAYMDKKYPQ